MATSIATVRITVLGVEQACPWWMCCPPTPQPIEPCPVRPIGFVPFSEYDQEFKFPLASSRKPMKIALLDGCITCSPTLINEVPPSPPPPPEPEPEPEICLENLVIDGRGLRHADWLPVSSWGGIFNEEVPYHIELRNGEESILLHLDSWDSNNDVYVRDDGNGWPLEDEFWSFPEYGEVVPTNNATIHILDLDLDLCAGISKIIGA